MLAEIETDKATIDWESQEEGFLAKIMMGDGEQGGGAGKGGGGGDGCVRSGKFRRLPCVSPIALLPSSQA